MTSLVIDLVTRPDSPNVHWPLPTTKTTTAAPTTTTTTNHPLRPHPHARFKDLPTSDMKEILLQRMLEENYDKGHAEHRVAYEALQGSIHHDECEEFDDDKGQEETKKKCNTPKMGRSGIRIRGMLLQDQQHKI
ncbi:hypothetical protein Tco_0446914, partial [Tanacetum coccineum]